MELYFAPLACSLATRITLYEVGAPAQNARFTQVDTRAKRIAGGENFLDVNPMGQVPVLRTDAGETLTENTAVLQYVADQFPGAKLAPLDALARARLQEWLGFIGTELHKAVFVPLLDPKAPEGAKAWAREKVDLRMARLEAHLSKHEHLLDTFTIADAYLTTILNWAAVTGVSLPSWPSVHAYHQRMLKRPSIARAFGEELALYQAELARAKAS